MEPFKVVCIALTESDVWHVVRDGKEIKSRSGPKKGDICIVIDSYTNKNNNLYYIIEGYSLECCYNAKYFLKINDTSFKQTTFKEINEKIPSCDN